MVISPFFAQNSTKLEIQKRSYLITQIHKETAINADETFLPVDGFGLNIALVPWQGRNLKSTIDMPSDNLGYPKIGISLRLEYFLYCRLIQSEVNPITGLLRILQLKMVRTNMLLRENKCPSSSQYIESSFSGLMFLG